MLVLAAGLTVASFFFGREVSKVAEQAAPTTAGTVAPAPAQPTKTEADATAMSVLKSVGISNAKDIDIEIMAGRPAVLKALAEARRARGVVITSIPRLERLFAEAQEAYDKAAGNLDTAALALKGKNRVSTDYLRTLEGLQRAESEARQRLNEAKDRLNEARAEQKWR